MITFSFSDLSSSSSRKWLITLPQRTCCFCTSNSNVHVTHSYSGSWVYCTKGVRTSSISVTLYSVTTSTAFLVAQTVTYKHNNITGYKICQFDQRLAELITKLVRPLNEHVAKPMFTICLSWIVIAFTRWCCWYTIISRLIWYNFLEFLQFLKNKIYI